MRRRERRIRRRRRSGRKGNIRKSQRRTKKN